MNKVEVEVEVEVDRKLGTKGNQSFTDFCIAGAEEISKAFCSEIAYLLAPYGSLNSMIECNHP